MEEKNNIVIYPKEDYENFGWKTITSSALTDKEDYYINNTGTNGEKLVNIKFKRDRKIKNKDKLNVLQKKCEETFKKIDKLEKESHTRRVTKKENSKYRRYQNNTRCFFKY